MKIYYLPFQFFILLRLMPVLETGELSEFNCINGTSCFKGPGLCSSSKTCDFFILFKYHQSSNEISFSIASKYEWIAFGLKTQAKFLMDGLYGEICMKNSTTAALQAFYNDGYSASFFSAIGVGNITTKAVDGRILCSYSRPVLAPEGTQLKNLNDKLYVIVAYGQVTGTKPKKHSKNSYAISAASVDFRSITSSKIELGDKYDKLVIAHGSLMSLAWLAFLAMAVFICRYKQFIEFSASYSCYQLHIILVINAVFMVATGSVMIFGFKDGWKPQGSGYHSYMGIFSMAFVMLYLFLILMRIDERTESCTTFKAIQSSVGVTVMISGAVTIWLGYNLLEIPQITVLIWICLHSLTFLATELFLQLKLNAASTVHVESSETSNGAQLQLELRQKISKVITRIAICHAVLVSTLALVTIMLEIRRGISKM